MIELISAQCMSKYFSSKYIILPFAGRLVTGTRHSARFHNCSFTGNYAQQFASAVSVFNLDPFSIQTDDRALEFSDW